MRIFRLFFGDEEDEEDIVPELVESSAPMVQAGSPFMYEINIPARLPNEPPEEKIDVARDIEYYSRLFEEPFDIQATPQERIPATVHALVQEHGIDRPGSFDYMATQATEGDVTRSLTEAREDLIEEGVEEPDQIEVNRRAYQLRLQPGYNTGAAVGLMQRQTNSTAQAVDFLRRNPNFRQQALEATLGGMYDDVDYNILSGLMEKIAELDSKPTADSDIVKQIQAISASGYYPFVDALMSMAETASLRNVKSAYETLSSSESPTYRMITDFQRSAELTRQEQDPQGVMRTVADTEAQGQITTRMQNYAQRYLSERTEGFILENDE